MRKHVNASCAYLAPITSASPNASTNNIDTTLSFETHQHPSFSVSIFTSTPRQHHSITKSCLVTRDVSTPPPCTTTVTDTDTILYPNLLRAYSDTASFHHPGLPKDTTSTMPRSGRLSIFNPWLRLHSGCSIIYPSLPSHSSESLPSSKIYCRDCTTGGKANYVLSVCGVCGLCFPSASAPINLEDGR